MEIIFLLAILLFSIVIHEVAHGAMANQLGDSTAKYQGRLSLNPIKHLDPFGSIIVPALLILTAGVGFGWAKPVPVNPFNFRDQKWGNLKVSVAGPAANLLLALLFGLTLRFFYGQLDGFGVVAIFAFIVHINLLLAFFNLMPIPPLDGSHILFTFLPESMRGFKMFLNQFGFFILLFVIFFNFHWIAFLVAKASSLITGFSII